MTLYLEKGMTRAVLCPFVDNVATPVTDELAAGIDVTALLHEQGAGISHRTDTIDRSKWKSPRLTEVPVRYSTDIVLRGYRNDVAALDELWNASGSFRAQAFLVIRRGLLTSEAWAAGQRCECFKFRYGKRSNISINGVQGVEIPLFVVDEDDDAEVA